MNRVVVPTGAGISAESGLQTFRGADGLWEGHRVEDVATPEAWAANPELVLDFYNQRRRLKFCDTVHELKRRELNDAVDAGPRALSAVARADPNPRCIAATSPPRDFSSRRRGGCCHASIRQRGR
jgi:hypothetical protein